MTGMQVWMASELRALERIANQCDWDEVARLLKIARALVSGELPDPPEKTASHRPDYDEEGFQKKIDTLICHANNHEWTEVVMHLIEARTAWASLGVDRRRTSTNRLN